MKLASLDDRLHLALPDRGMPIILNNSGFMAQDLAGWETIHQRSNRINGIDVPLAAAQYLPTGGMGNFGWPAVQGHRNGTQFILEPNEWNVINGEDTLTLEGLDSIAEIKLILHFKLAATLIMHCELINIGKTPYNLDRCMAGTVLIAGGAETITSYRGKWGQEFQEIHEPAGDALWLLESRKGRTSHDRYPAIMVKDFAGGHHTVHLGWSGNHCITVDRLDDGQSLIHTGELFEPGEMILDVDETYTSPKAYYTCEPLGYVADLADTATAFHETLRKQVLTWPNGKMKPRPVLLNTWEGNYFNHDVERLMQQATIAAEVGIERFVLDDGWFGKRDDDTSSLGDWFIDKRKYPDGLKPLIDHVVSLGMEFGLWFEPEMVNQNSDLFRAHPDWTLQVKGRPLLESRHQHVLDLTRIEVTDYLFNCMHDVLKSNNIAYIKWDMNRDLTHAAGADGRAKTHAQTRAVYALMNRVRVAHPNVEIESCASGGGRADYGVLEHSHRVWVSDCTDPLERLEIQRGARRFLVPEIMGCHISASPNHQTRRIHTLAFRAIVAFFGHLGVELDPSQLSPEMREELRGWIALHKSLRHIMHSPEATSFDLPVVDGRYIFGVVLHDKNSRPEHMIVAVAQGPHPKREQPAPLRLPIHNVKRNFTIKEIGPVKCKFARSIASQYAIINGQQKIAGDLISSHGIPLPILYPESAILLEIKSERTL